MAGFCYCFSFLFNNHSKAQLTVMIGSFLTGFVLPMIAFTLELFDNTKKINHSLMMFYRIIPAFSFGHALLSINFMDSLTFLIENKKFSASDGRIAGHDITALWISFFVYLIIAIGIENFLAMPALSGYLRNKFYRPPTLEPVLEDEDVVEEAQRCQTEAEKRTAGQATESGDVILMNKVTKVFPGGKFAVKGLSIGIPYGQCFGLLGINGAGKTTTMGMLTGEFPPSSGNAWLAGKNILTEANEVRRLIGYCPQFDALFGLMTGREHLMMYARIKGIPESHIKAIVEQKIRQMDLQNHCDRAAGSYSGGNKRKLSVACAMIGVPRIVFLDEPSTGMDPVARRFMWQVINDIVATGNTSVILTTHSMEECEALCSRIGIMVGGRFRCLGSAQHLKTRFGLGYQLEFGFKVVDQHEDKFVTIFGELVAAHELVSAKDKRAVDAVITLSQAATILDKAGKVVWKNQLMKADSEFHHGSTLIDLAVWCIAEQNVLDLARFMQNEFPGAVLRESQRSRVRYEVPSKIDGRDVKLSKMFGLLERQKAALGLQEYSLSQTSLEQIFNGFAGQQEEEKGAAKGISNQKSSESQVAIAT
jgi:ABC-type multidrug transport system ATPase subunit